MGSEISFTENDLAFHTAADGIAIVGGNSDSTNNTTDSVPIFTAPAKVGEADFSPTHSNFTLPVQMDDDNIGILTIPDIDLLVSVYESEDEMVDMTKGAANFKSTSAFDSNVGLSAHNINLDGSPGYFMNLYTLKKGAVIRYKTALGEREYQVESVNEITETDWSKLGRTEDNRITLITCISGKPTKRLCVQAVEQKS